MQWAAAKVIVDSHAELFTHDGAINFGFGSHECRDEVSLFHQRLGLRLGTSVTVVTGVTVVTVVTAVTAVTAVTGARGAAIGIPEPLGYPSLISV